VVGRRPPAADRAHGARQPPREPTDGRCPAQLAGVAQRRRSPQRRRARPGRFSKSAPPPRPVRAGPRRAQREAGAPDRGGARASTAALRRRRHADTPGGDGSSSSVAGVAEMAVSRAFPSWKRSILTGIYLGHARSHHEIEDGNARTGGAGGRRCCRARSCRGS
jgi:hypothetical protein